MNKKIYLIFLICIIISSCGKKGNPVYKEKESKIYNIKSKIV